MHWLMWAWQQPFWTGTTVTPFQSGKARRTANVTGGVVQTSLSSGRRNCRTLSLIDVTIPPATQSRIPAMALNSVFFQDLPLPTLSRAVKQIWSCNSPSKDLWRVCHLDELRPLCVDEGALHKMVPCFLSTWAVPTLHCTQRSGHMRPLAASQAHWEFSRLLPLLLPSLRLRTIPHPPGIAQMPVLLSNLFWFFQRTPGLSLGSQALLPIPLWHLSYYVTITCLSTSPCPTDCACHRQRLVIHDLQLSAPFLCMFLERMEKSVKYLNWSPLKSD